MFAQEMKQEWSPEQIHGKCKADNIYMISHESIYQFVWQK
jgi:IS30 family transposase